MNPTRLFPRIVVRDCDNVTSFGEEERMGYSGPPMTKMPRGAWYAPPKGLDPVAWVIAVAEVCQSLGEPNPLQGWRFYANGQMEWYPPRPIAPPPPPRARTAMPPADPNNWGRGRE